jgi:hypothetical protein
MYKYFHPYEVRSTELQHVCYVDDDDTEYKTVLQHGDTHIVFLFPGMGRPVDTYGPFEAHFIGQ